MESSHAYLQGTHSKIFRLALVLLGIFVFPYSHAKDKKTKGPIPLAAGSFLQVHFEYKPSGSIISAARFKGPTSDEALIDVSSDPRDVPYKLFGEAWIQAFSDTKLPATTLKVGRDSKPNKLNPALVIRSTKWEPYSQSGQIISSVVAYLHADGYYQKMGSFTGKAKPPARTNKETQDAYRTAMYDALTKVLEKLQTNFVDLPAN